MIVFVLALVTAALGVAPLVLSARRKAAMPIGAIYALLAAGIYYLSIPSLAYPFGGGVAAVTIAYMLISPFLALVGSEARQTRRLRQAGYRTALPQPENTKGRTGLIVMLPIFAALAVSGRACVGCEALNTNDYATMIGQTSERTWTQDVQPKDPKHIRLVPMELAFWEADKQLGQAAGAIGSQFELAKKHATLQMVNGILWYVLPLDYSGFSAWSAANGAPGYLMVNAEDPHAAVKVVTDKTYLYTPEAFFSKNLARHLWSNGYAGYVLTEYNLEIDESGKAWWVVSAMKPTIGYYAQKVEGVVIVDPENGAITFHALGHVPEWIDRVVPQDTVKDYLAWRGDLGGGWKNSWWGKKNLTQPEVPNIAYGADGHPYWVTCLTSTSTKDSSLIMVAYTSTRTGVTTDYRMSGGTDEAIINAVDQKVSYKHWHGADPVFYNIYGQPSAIVPMLGTNHAFMGVAIVNITSLQVAEGTDEITAYAEYQKLLVNTGGTVTPEMRKDAKTVTGKVDRFAAEVKTTGTTYYLHLQGIDRIYSGTSTLSPKLPLTQIGDTVTITHYPSEDGVLPMSAFDDASITLRPAQK